MRKIISLIRPFDIEQTIMVYEDGNKLDVVTANLDNLNSIVLGLVEKYDVYNLNLIGPQKFLNGIGNKIKKEFSLKYSNKELTININ